MGKDLSICKCNIKNKNSSAKQDGDGNVPELRFPGFYAPWEEHSLSEICDFFSGGTPSSSEREFYGGNIPFIRSGELHRDRTELTVTASGMKHSAAKMVRKGDLLLALCGATSGDIAISRIDGAINQAILCIRTGQNTRFLESVWKRHSRRLLSKYLQGGQGNLSAGIIKKIVFSFPEIREQDKIADFISLIDRRIAVQDRIIAKYGVLAEEIEDKLIWSGNGCSIPLSEILIERNEKTTGSNMHKVLSSSTKGICLQCEYFTRNVAKDDNTGYKVVRLHDIVICPQNLWMGNINFNDRFDTGIVSPSYKVFSVAKGFDTAYIVSMLRSRRTLSRFGRISGQGASAVRRNLDLTAFGEMTFRLPPLDIQAKHGHIISSIRRRLELAISLRNAYVQQKRYMLAKLLI